MALYLGSKKVAVTNTVEKKVPSMKAFFEAGGKCVKSKATSFDGCWQFGDTANIRDMYSMFSDCDSLAVVPPIDASNSITMQSMFLRCNSLTTLSLLNTSKVNITVSMFEGCSSLITAPLFDTSNVESMNYMFSACSKLNTVPEYNLLKVNGMDYMFSRCSSLEAIHMININANLDIHWSTKFTREALLEIIGNLKAQTSGTKTLTMGSTNLAKLNEEDKAIATNKGWTLA